ncbi:MAG: hypothetical protein ACRD2L_24195, partial [Terriglobia bacterium]
MAKQKGPSQWSETALKLTQGIWSAKGSERAERDLAAFVERRWISTPSTPLTTALPSPGLVGLEFAWVDSS